MLPISWADMDAYFRLWRIAPQAWELRAIRRLDAEYLESRSTPAEAGAVDSASSLTRHLTGRGNG